MNDFKKVMKELGWKLSIRTRKLAKGPKRYIHIHWIDQSLIVEQVPYDLIRHYFPQSHMTSGSYVSGDFTFAEFWS